MIERVSVLLRGLITMGRLLVRLGLRVTHFRTAPRKVKRIHRKAVLPFSEAWTGWRGGQRGT